MYAFYISNLATGKEKVIFGYDLRNAYKRAGLDGGEWVMKDREYVDQTHTLFYCASRPVIRTGACTCELLPGRP